MSLDKYWSKRNFEKTAEPSGKPATPSRGKSAKRKPRAEKSAGELRYVIQKHAASHLHYDFRLELDGTLKSWAVPKGPSLDPKDKRLAVQVEDHPLEYAGFEGTIAEGEYGAGHVIVWDHGTWVPPKGAMAQLKKGRLEFELKGEKLEGKWLLIRTHAGARKGSANWLLIKRTDSKVSTDIDITEERPESVITGRTLEETKVGKRTKLRKPVARATQAARARIEAKRTSSVRALSRNSVARASRLSTIVRPQLATLVDRPPAGDAWIHEIKFDGYRAICEVEEDYVSIRTRSGLDWTEKFPWLAKSMQGLAASAVLDGEIVALEKEGRTSFGALQAALKKGSDEHLAYFAFDLLSLDGEDLREQPLLERKRRLKELLESAADDRLRYSEHWTTSGAKMLEASCSLDLEGIVSKRADEPYVSGRTKDWLKSKCKKAQELVIGGFTRSTSGAREGFRSLLVGTFDGDELVYCGRVGTGFDSATLKELSKRMKSLVVSKCPFDANVPSDVRDAVWIEPELVANVEFAEWTADGVLRHPSFQGLREDKPAREIVVEKPKVLLEAMATESKRLVRPVKRGRAARPAAETVKLTHPDKVLFADPKTKTEITKQDLASYYQQVAKWILPHISDRPLSLLRCPQGAAGECFFQKHSGQGAARGKTALIKSEFVNAKERGTKEEVLYVDEIDDVLRLVQLGALELHAWGCHRKTLERPDLIVFDLDPDAKVGWNTVVETAFELKELLAKLELDSFVNATGGKGLHLHVPIAPEYTWDQVKSFSKAVAVQMVRDFPDRFTANISKSKRSGKIFLDYLRNGYGATAIVPYSLRAKPSAPIAMPISWTELERLESPTIFTIDYALDYLAKRKVDPWSGYFEVEQRLAIFDSQASASSTRKRAGKTRNSH